MAPTAVSRLPKAVMTTTGTSGRFATMRSHSSSPFIARIFKSVTTTSNDSVSMSESASSAAARNRQSKPLRASPLASMSPMAASSSTIKIALPMESILDGGKVNGEAAAVADVVVSGDPTAVLLDDAVTHGQAEPRPLADVLGSEEGLEDTRQVLGRDSSTLVHDSQTHVVALARCAARFGCAHRADVDFDAPTVGHGLDRVEHQV